MSWVYKSSSPVMIFCSTCGVGIRNIASSMYRAKAVLPSSGRVGSSSISTSSPFSSKSGSRPYFIFLMAGNTRCCMVRKISRESLSLNLLHRMDWPASLAGKMCSIFSPAMLSNSSVASSFSSSDRMNMR